MSSDKQINQAVGVLQELGLKEYEAKSFVALSRIPKATAKEISESTDVPRTRVYDAIRVLEAKGLVEVQHSSPKQFRAVPLSEALDTLETLYQSRIKTLRDTIQGMEPIKTEEDSSVQEVWSLTESQTIGARAESLIEEAEDEIVLVIGEEAVLTEDLVTHLSTANKDLDILIGAATKSIQARIQDILPEATVFVTGLDWLHGEGIDSEETAIGRLMLVDRETILVSSWEPDSKKERAIFGTGFSNGLVVIARRLMATGLIPGEDPAEN